MHVCQGANGFLPPDQCAGPSLAAVQAFRDMRAYYNEITHANLDLIKNLKARRLLLWFLTLFLCIDSFWGLAGARAPDYSAARPSSLVSAQRFVSREIHALLPPALLSPTAAGGDC